jgi:predicted MPP superfamily phosphohydrolase
MTEFLESLFPILAITIWIAIPVYAAIARGRFYAIFSAVILSCMIPSALVLHMRLVELASSSLRPYLHCVFAYSMAAAGIQLAHLVRARLRGNLFRWLDSVPGQTFIAGGMLAGPWLLLLLPFRLSFGYLDWQGALVALTLLDALPLLVAVFSIATSLTTRHETVRFDLAHDGPETLQRVPVERLRGRKLESPATSARLSPSLPTTTRGATEGSPRPLRIVQLTDTHIGPWQSVARLRRVVETLVARDPDLIALTGDFLTMESMGTPGCLEAALQPLEKVSDRCVAIFGNHDHEAPQHVIDAMRVLGIPLLIDDEFCLETAAGPVQIVGADYVHRDHAKHLGGLLTRFPRRAEHLRLLLLHDPVGFHALPEDEVDLVLSGHTHGGQVGLVSLGLDWTVLARTRWPDQGLFARGRSRLYVHRGTGFYGFPLRVGVPAEFSVLEITPA